MNLQSVQRYDQYDMYSLLRNFPHQVEDAVRIGKQCRIPFKRTGITSLVVTGLGGSAIGGDLLRSYVQDELEIPFVVNRNYTLPEFVDHRTLVIVSSYSGNTEETVAAHAEARKRKAKIICITSNGETAKMALKYNQPLITIPRGLPPRIALGYSFFPLLEVMSKLNLISRKNKDIRETVGLLKKKSGVYSVISGKNPAVELAKQLYTKCPIIYSGADKFDIVNLRWRGQIAENAKSLAFGHVIPEMNHNELVGWKILRRMMEEDFAAVFLRDGQDHPRIKVRMEITKSIVEQYATRVIEVKSEGRSLLARMFSLIYLGDWMSFYLAILNGIDPTPVRVIDYLKGELAKL
jgi:glucose/mannose-6-phosphate isomerase